MKVHKKALYNLLKMKLEENSNFKHSCQLEDYELLTIEEIFLKLEKFKIFLDKKSFSYYTDEVDSPEELFECLEVEKKDADKVFLLIFELWKRLCPEKQSLSIFCNDLDKRLFLYENNQLESDEPIQTAFSNLVKILDENVDNGGDPIKIFEDIASYCAHDLEAFIYDYISDQIDHGNCYYAHELLEGFYPYMPHLKWFDLLRIRLATDRIQVLEILDHIFKDLTEFKDLDFKIELLHAIHELVDQDIFISIAFKTMDLIKTERDFLDLLEIITEFFRKLDKEDVEKAIETILLRRLNHEEDLLDKKDPDFIVLKRILTVQTR